MAICYHCKQKEKIYGRKYVGEKICFNCHALLGFSICLSTHESMKADKRKGGYQNFEELVQLVKPRKALYDELVANFIPSRTFTLERPNYTGEDKIEIDEQGKTIRIIEGYTNGVTYSKNPSIVYIRYSDILSITSDSSLSCLKYNLLGQAEDNYFFRPKEREKDLFNFFDEIVKTQS